MHCRQIGLSLVELMIAMAISSFLILGVTQILIDNKNNYRYQQSQSENQENGRFTLMLFEKELFKTGFRRRPDQNPEQAFPALSSGGCVFTTGQTINKVDDSTICLRYQPRDTAELDCTGTAIGDLTDLDTPYKAPNSSFIEKISIINGSLVCNGTSLIADGVAAINFDFGIGGTAEKDVTSYTQSPGTSPIRSLRYSVLLSSTQNSVAQGISSKACTEWQNLTAADTSPCVNDKIYQIVSSSVTLRNLMP